MTTNTTTKHIVFYSSGISSYVAAKRVAAEHGAENLILLFADTGIEDIDNYRFLHESAELIGGHLAVVRNTKDSTVYLGRDDVAILKRSAGGVVRPFPLSELRREVEASGQLDLLDWGGCGCFSDE